MGHPLHTDHYRPEIGHVIDHLLEITREAEEKRSVDVLDVDIVLELCGKISLAQSRAFELPDRLSLSRMALT